MTINSEEEEIIRKAGKLVNEKIRNFRENYGINDIQDLLAMVSFDVLSENMLLKEQSRETDKTIIEKIETLYKKVTIS